jgi:class 3 adenylate cyclase
MASLPRFASGSTLGEATARDDDYFGSAVTRAARISAAAGAGEVLVSAELLAACERPVRTAGERTLELKGIAEPQAAVLIEWSTENEAESSSP